MSHEEMVYFLYDFERGMWWGWCQMGYTHDVREAGLYHVDEAIEITSSANKYEGQLRTPNTAMIPALQYGYAEMQKIANKQRELELEKHGDKDNG